MAGAMSILRYIPVPTGNSHLAKTLKLFPSVYPCTYRELPVGISLCFLGIGISLYLQGTRVGFMPPLIIGRYIPVPTGNSCGLQRVVTSSPVYPCTYRELKNRTSRSHCPRGISLYLQGTRKHSCPFF